MEYVYMGNEVLDTMIVNWQDPLPQLKLNQGDVHIWYTSLKLGGYYCSNNINLLSLEEKKQAEAYKFDRDRERFVARRIILRHILEKKYGKLLKESKIRLNAYGKPKVVSGALDVFLSLSHSENSVIYAISKSFEIGIDMEFVRKLDYKPILQTLLPNYMGDNIDSSKEFDDIVSFYHVWTSVEAYLKAIGTGFSNALDDTFWGNFPFEIFEKRVRNCHWSVLQFMPEENFFCTFMANSPKVVPSFYVFTDE